MQDVVRLQAASRRRAKLWEPLARPRCPAGAETLGDSERGVPWALLAVLAASWALLHRPAMLIDLPSHSKRWV